MQITINLTTVLVALIICTFLYAICKMAKKDEEKKLKSWERPQLKVLQVSEIRNDKKVNREQNLMEYVEEQVRKGEGKK